MNYHSVGVTKVLLLQTGRLIPYNLRSNSIPFNCTNNLSRSWGSLYILVIKQFPIENLKTQQKDGLRPKLV